MTDFGSRDDNDGGRSSSNNDNDGAADNSESASARRGACASSYCNGGCFAASPADIPPALITTHPAAFDDLARQLPQLTGALTMTGNGVTLLSESGQYSTPSFTDGPLLWDHNRVNLRLNAPAVRSVAISDELPVARIPAMISVLDSHNRTLHRGYLLSATDRRLLDTLGTARPSDTKDVPTPTISASPGAPSSPATPTSPATRTSPATPTSSAIPTSPAVPANPGRDEWASADQLDHIDAIIRDGGVGRYRTVGSFRMPRSRRVSPDAIPNLFTTLWRKELSITAAVVTEGCMQFHRGALDLVDPAPGALTAASAGATIAIALDSVADCWLVTTHGIHGSTSMLELYDAAGHCVALFTQLGPVGQDVVDEWQQLTASLVS